MQEQAYLRRINTIRGVFIGKAAVDNNEGKCFAMAINTQETPVQFEIPPRELVSFDFEEAHDLFYSELDFDNPSPRQERVRKILERLRRQHHSKKTSAQLRRVVEEFTELLSLGGDKAAVTHVV